MSPWGQQQELTDDEQAGKAAFVEDFEALKKRHTTPVRKAHRGQIQGKQEDMRASLVCARVEGLTCDGVSVKVCGLWFDMNEQHFRRDILRAGVISSIQVCWGREFMPDLT